MVAIDVKGDFEFDVSDTADDTLSPTGEKTVSPEAGADTAASDNLTTPFSLKNIDIAVPEGL